MMKIVTVIGARPQFVKAAVMSRAFRAFPEIRETLVHTGQHYDSEMSGVFFRELEMPDPAYHLGINKENLLMEKGKETGPAALVGRMMQALEEVCFREKPQWILVYGDTDSTLAGALTAAKLGIPLIHVEAGLRSYNNRMPEETNRIVTDRLSRLLFCPSDRAVKNLEKEGFRDFPVRIFRCGDIMQDAALHYGRCPKPIHEINDLKDFIVCTIHRNETLQDPTALIALFSILERISAEMPVVMPLHPGTRKKLKEYRYRFENSPIRFLEPASYLQMAYLLKHCRLVITDSGGIQKEAYFFRKMCLTVRKETEWTELVENGCNLLVGQDPEKLLPLSRRYWNGTGTVRFPENLYGDGQAGLFIARSIVSA